MNRRRRRSLRAKEAHRQRQKRLPSHPGDVFRRLALALDDSRVTASWFYRFGDHRGRVEPSSLDEALKAAYPAERMVVLAWPRLPVAPGDWRWNAEDRHGGW